MGEVKQARLFLSYARKDMGEVRELYELLKSYGFSPWMDIFDVKTGQDWLEVVIETIEEAPIFMACLSNHSITKTGVVRQEINEALEVAKRRILSGEDIYIFPIRLEEIEAEKIPRKLRKYNWVDWYTETGKKKLIADLKAALKQLGFYSPLNLRSQPLELTAAEAAQMIRERNFYGAEAAQMIMERNFYDETYYWKRAGISHEYEPQTIDGDKIIIDHTTGLTWQQGGSPSGMRYEDVKEYIAELNTEKFANLSDWRLPTLEEAMSLVEPEPKKNANRSLYINPLFDDRQMQIWTADRAYSASTAWTVDFFYGRCNRHLFDIIFTIFARAVRSGR